MSDTDIIITLLSVLNYVASNSFLCKITMYSPSVFPFPMLLHYNVIYWRFDDMAFKKCNSSIEQKSNTATGNTF